LEAAAVLETEEVLAALQMLVEFPAFAWSRVLTLR